jgi:hypothetical protein
MTDDIREKFQVQKNPKDPLLKAAESAALELAERYSIASDGFSGDQIITAAGHMILTVLRRAYPSHTKAEARLDEMVGNMKNVLSHHYVSGRRIQGQYPFNQRIIAPHPSDVIRSLLNSTSPGRNGKN